MPSPCKRKLDNESNENDTNALENGKLPKQLSKPILKSFEKASYVTELRADNTRRPITICVEGNIGCGKTTLLNFLSQQDDVEVFEEPVSKWRNVRGQNLLDLMYQDPGRWAHLFQTYVQLTMMQLHMKPCSSRLKVLERSVHSARHCFVENLYRSGHMSDAEYNVYCEWYHMISQHLPVPVDLIVYLSVSTDEVANRIRHRGRKEEQGIPAKYLQELHDLHETWLSSGDLPAPLLVLPQGLSLEEMNERIQSKVASLNLPSSCEDVVSPRPALAEISAN